VSEVGVDGDDLVVVPTESDSPAAKVILASGALGVLDDLAQSGLADIQIGRASQVLGSYLGERFVIMVSILV
jgi:hypothetical protein